MRTTYAVNAAIAVTALGAGSALAAGTALAAGHYAPVARPDAAQTHTLKFTAKHTSTIVVSKSAYILTDNDVKDGKLFGADVLSCHDTSSASLCTVAFGLRGGELYGAFTLSHTDGSLRGRVTGGSGSFAHDSGTIAGQSVSPSRTSVTVVYHG